MISLSKEKIGAQEGYMAPIIDILSPRRKAFRMSTYVKVSMFQMPCDVHITSKMLTTTQPILKRLHYEVQVQ